MFFQCFIRLLLVFLLAIEIRTVEGTEGYQRVVSLDADNEYMGSMLNKRRRWGWIKKTFKKVKNLGSRAGNLAVRGVRKVGNLARRGARKVVTYYKKTHPRALRRCKVYCPMRSLRCGKFFKVCLKRCISRCYLRYGLKRVIRYIG